MALECPVGTDSFKSKRSGIKETTANSVSRPVLINYFTKGGHKRPVLSKPVTGFEKEKSSAEQDCTVTDDSSSNGCRTITDLPPALVSEILHRLDAKDLGVVSCVSTLLYSIASDHQGWKKFYCDRWGPPLLATKPSGPGLPLERSWKVMFTEREFRSNAFTGRYSVDVLHGHTEAVRSVCLLPNANIIFTGGYDSIIRLWDMEDGLAISTSRPLGCTIRAIAADTDLLICGGTGAFLQCWRAVDGHPHLFDFAGSTGTSTFEFRLWGHEGPVTCLALDSLRIFSGSWDMTVRVWDRAQLKCINVLRHGDWVWALVPRGSTVASTAGQDAYLWDIESGGHINVFHGAHSGNAHALARSLTGELLFTGGEDGAVRMFEVKRRPDVGDGIAPVATWMPHTGPVNSLAFEFPWLVSSSNDGRIALIDVRKILKLNRQSLSQSHYGYEQHITATIEAPQRMLNGFGCNLFSVGIGAERIVCGGEEGVVRVWNFSQALEIEKRVQALRRARWENRMRRRQVQNEMNSKSGRGEHCSFAAKKGQMNGDRNGVWHAKRGVAGKLKT